MIEHVPELVNAGIDSFKIEGRMKTALYVATVARTYRKAIDDYLESEEKYRANLPYYKEEIGKCTYRQFTTGFYFGKPGPEEQVYDNNEYVKDYIYIGKVESVDEAGRIQFVQRNKFVGINCTGYQEREDGSGRERTPPERAVNGGCRVHITGGDDSALSFRRMTGAVCSRLFFQCATHRNGIY